MNEVDGNVCDPVEQEIQHLMAEHPDVKERFSRLFNRFRELMRLCLESGISPEISADVWCEMDVLETAIRRMEFQLSKLSDQTQQFDRLPFKTYRKTKPTEVRWLDTVDHIAYKGVIQTAEGPSSFEVGDFLARDAKGFWPIAHLNIVTNYEYVGQTGDGWLMYLPLEPREAVQMTEQFTIDGLTGQAGDYLLRRKDEDGYHYWPCNKDIFEGSYELIQEKGV
jgi:hypothetical protein